MAIPQPTIPGYSPWPTARQDTPYLQTPGVQGLTEGVSANQGIGFSPTAEFFGGGMTGTAPPSNIAPSGNMWSQFHGSGGAESSTATPNVPSGIQQLINALRGGR